MGKILKNNAANFRNTIKKRLNNHINNINNLKRDIKRYEDSNMIVKKMENLNLYGYKCNRSNK